MKTIDLQCPGCDTLLELDRGFAGGVCRCSDCGTLMTVPDEPSELPERLERPDAPGRQNASRTESPASEPARPSRPPSPQSAPSKRSPQKRKPTKKKPRARAAKREPELHGTHTYRTASGRTITVDHDRVIPMAPAKRHAVRAATVLVFVAVVGGVLFLCGFAAYLMWTQPTAQEVAVSTYVETFDYDADTNPYTIPAPHVLGLPLSNRVAVVYDVTTLSGEQLADVNPLLLDGLRRGGSAVNVTLIVNLAEGNRDVLLKERPLDTLDADDLGNRLEGLPAGEDDSAVLSAVQEALDAEPEVLVIVTGRDVDGPESKSVDRLVPTSDVRLDVVMIDADSFGLEDASRARRGHYVTLSSDDELDRWRP